MNGQAHRLRDLQQQMIDASSQLGAVASKAPLGLAFNMIEDACAMQDAATDDPVLAKLAGLIENELLKYQDELKMFCDSGAAGRFSVDSDRWYYLMHAADALMDVVGRAHSFCRSNYSRKHTLARNMQRGYGWG